MYCTKCGNNCEQGLKFCPKCGNNLSVNQQVSSYTQQSNNSVYQQQSYQQPTYQNNNAQRSYTQQSNNNVYQQQSYQQPTYQNNNVQQSYTQQSNNKVYQQQSYQQPTYQNNNVQPVIYNNQFKKKKSNAWVFVLICLIFLVVGGFFFIQIISGGTGIYINTEERNENVTTGESSNTSSGNSRTVIENEKTYTSNVSSVSDVNKFIKQESAEQRKNCSSANSKLDLSVESKYDIAGVNFCEIDPNFASELVKVIDYYYTNYPSIKGYLNNFTITNGDSIGQNGVIAYYRPFYPTITTEDGQTVGGKQSINMMAYLFLNKSKLSEVMKNSSDSGHFPPNTTIVSPVAHEMGHYLSFVSIIKYYKLENVNFYDMRNIEIFYKVINDYGTGAYSKSLIEEAYRNYTAKNGNSLSFDEFRETISGYAVTKDSSTGKYLYDETIAEAVHDVYLNRDKAKEASKYINAVLSERLK